MVLSLTTQPATWASSTYFKSQLHINKNKRI